MNERHDERGVESSRLALDHTQPPPPGPGPWSDPAVWFMPDLAPEHPDDPVRPLAALVTFHYLRAAIRRRWLRCLVPALIGLLLSLGYLAANPARPGATMVLFLAHDAQVDPQSATATDTSLLTTRTIAEETISKLGLSISPEELLGSVKVVPTGSAQIMQLTMRARTSAEAVRELKAFSEVYLAFRAEQVTSQSRVQIDAHKKRISDLNTQLQAVNDRIDALAVTGNTATNPLGDALTDRSRLNEQIDALQIELQEEALQRDTVVVASRVIDPPVAIPAGFTKTAVLALASGLIGGSFLGLVLVVLQAILSDRLWLRVEVASALEAPVLLSVRKLIRPSRWAPVQAFLPIVRGVAARRASDRQRVVKAITTAVLAPGQRKSLAVVCLGNSANLRVSIWGAAAALQEEGFRTTIVDMTEARAAGPRLDGLFAGLPEPPEVVRPSIVPSLHRGASFAGTPERESARPNGAKAVTLVLVDLDPAAGLDHVRPWASRAIVAVRAGKSSAELVRTAGDLTRAARLHLHGAVLLRAARDDTSTGAVPVPPPVSPAQTRATEPNTVESPLPRFRADNHPDRSRQP